MTNYQWVNFRSSRHVLTFSQPQYGANNLCELGRGDKGNWFPFSSAHSSTTITDSKWRRSRWRVPECVHRVPLERDLFCRAWEWIKVLIVILEGLHSLFLVVPFLLKRWAEQKKGQILSVFNLFENLLRTITHRTYKSKFSCRTLLNREKKLKRRVYAWVPHVFYRAYAHPL